MQVLLMNEKHGTRAIEASDKEKAAAYVVKQRLDDGYWYEGPAVDAAKKALSNNKAFAFLRQRDEYEYEGFELVTLEKPSM